LAAADFLLSIFSAALKGQEQSIELIPALRGTELPEIDINSIAQDSAGFLWIGTWKGLYRYDGREVINYSLHMNNKIGRKISTLFLDSEGNVVDWHIQRGAFCLQYL
jgi:ligand-binding sensor domain-containing protein